MSVLSRPSTCFKGKWWHFNNLLLNAAKFLFPLETPAQRGNLLSCSKNAPLCLIPSAGNSAVLVQQPGCWGNCTVPVPSLPCSPLLRCSPGSPCVFCSLRVIKLHGSAKLMSGVSMASLLSRGRCCDTLPAEPASGQVLTVRAGISPCRQTEPFCRWEVSAFALPIKSGSPVVCAQFATTAQRWHLSCCSCAEL